MNLSRLAVWGVVAVAIALVSKWLLSQLPTEPPGGLYHPPTVGPDGVISTPAGIVENIAGPPTPTDAEGWGIPGTVDIHQDPAWYTVEVELAPGIIHDTPNVVSPAYEGSCGLLYSQDGAWSLPKPPDCGVECPPREGLQGWYPDGRGLPTTVGAGGFNCTENSYDDCGRQICAYKYKGQVVKKEVAPGCNYVDFYLLTHICPPGGGAPSGMTGSGG